MQPLDQAEGRIRQLNGWRYHRAPLPEMPGAIPFSLRTHPFMTTTDPAVSVPTVSVVIPFYNAGKYILEAVDSVEKYHDRSTVEIIIVNDGSTEAESLRILERIRLERGYQIIHQTNRGPAAARNTGIRASRGCYVLLLDSDNKIRTRYISAGIELLDRDATVGVVHGNAAFFGVSDKPRFTPRPFDLQAIILGNYIDNCTVIRKSAWAEVGEFDEARILIGHEDWEFWIRMGAKGWKFRHVDETLFDYRVRPDSLINSVSPKEYVEMNRYVISKNLHVVMQQYSQLLNFKQRNPLARFFERLACFASKKKIP
jgi:glycosyltransferase involved in cell wall biosynthesis